MLVLMAGIFLSSCFERNKNVETEKFYFDLSGFFKTEAEKLNEKKFFAEKYLINDNDTQKLILKNISWEEELAPFINSDINKPAWKGSYKIDSISEDQKLKFVSYKSLETNLPVKEIQVHFNNKEVSHLYIENATNNYVYNSARVLSYNAGTGFSIEGEQDIFLGKDLHYKVFVNFIK